MFVRQPHRDSWEWAFKRGELQDTMSWGGSIDSFNEGTDFNVRMGSGF